MSGNIIFEKGGVKLDLSSIMAKLWEEGALSNEDRTLVRFGMLPKNKFEFIVKSVKERVVMQVLDLDSPEAAEPYLAALKGEWSTEFDKKMAMAFFGSVEMIV